MIWCLQLMKVKNPYLKILEYLHLSFNKWQSIQYKFWVSLVLWNHNNGEHCWLGNGPEDDHWHLHKESKSQRVITERGGCSKSAVSKHIKSNVDWKEEIGWKMCTSNRDDRKLENTVKQSRFKHLRELHKERTEADACNEQSTEGERSDEPKCSLFTTWYPHNRLQTKTDLTKHERTRLTNSRLQH